MPQGGTSFYYSFNWSLFHVISISTLHDYTIGSPQYSWLENDLINANVNRGAHPWIIRTISFLYLFICFFSFVAFPLLLFLSLWLTVLLFCSVWTSSNVWNSGSKRKCIFEITTRRTSLQIRSRCRKSSRKENVFNFFSQRRSGVTTIIMRELVPSTMKSLRVLEEELQRILMSILLLFTLKEELEDNKRKTTRIILTLVLGLATEEPLMVSSTFTPSSTVPFFFSFLFCFLPNISSPCCFFLRSFSFILVVFSACFLRTHLVLKAPSMYI